MRDVRDALGPRGEGGREATDEDRSAAVPTKCASWATGEVIASAGAFMASMRMGPVG